MTYHSRAWGPHLAERFFDRKCSIFRNTRTRTGAGGWTEVEGLVQANVDCCIRPLSRRERLVAAREEAREADIIYVQGNVEVRRDDVIVVDGVADRRFLVRYIENPQYANIYLRLEVEGFSRGT